MLLINCILTACLFKGRWQRFWDELWLALLGDRARVAGTLDRTSPTRFQPRCHQVSNIREEGPLLHTPFRCRKASSLQTLTKNGLNFWKVTSETISIGFLLVLRSFWVVTWLVYDKFEFGDKNGPKLLRNGQKWPKIVRNGQKWLLSLKKTRIDLVYVTSGPFWSLKGGWVTFFQSRGQNGPKIQFCHREKFFMKQ